MIIVLPMKVFEENGGDEDVDQCPPLIGDDEN